MKNIKTYLVIKNNPTLDTIRIYHAGKSRRAAKKDFIDRAIYFFGKAYADDVKLQFIKINLTKSDYQFLIDDFDSLSLEVINELWYGSQYEELGMINNKTFELDFLPYFCQKTGINPIVLEVDGMLENLKAGKTIWPWVKKYLKRNF